MLYLDEFQAVVAILHIVMQRGYWGIDLPEPLDCGRVLYSEQSALKMGTVRYSETLVLACQDTVFHNPEGSNVDVLSCNLRL
jgi:hypothetical protein